MATIEPRLIHLLNESTATPRPHHAELPPIKGLSLPKASGRPHPIEPDAGRRSDGVTEPNAAQLAAPPPRPTLYPVGDDGSAPAAPGPSQRREPSGGGSSYATTATTSLLNHISSQDLRMILDDPPPVPAPDGPEDHLLVTKKRPSKEDFMQLPQPLKKQKSGTQPQHHQHVFPPIIVGLLEPPLNAALFPPISSESFDGRPRSEPPQALGLGTQAPPPPATEALPSGPDDGSNTNSSSKPAASPSPETDKMAGGKTTTTATTVKRRAAKPRRKWSEEETNHLLRGVSKHGVGRWTDILADKEYSFNERSAGDLKDRFRTCCPEELRANLMAKKEAAKDKQQPQQLQPPSQPQPQATAAASGHEGGSGSGGGGGSGSKPRKGLMSENILNETEEDVDMERAATQNDSDSAGAAGPPQQQQQQQRKSRAHRKKMEDLVELGIKGPFKKSHRRERRPFSEQDDREILEGFELYGPQWTKIQRDPRFHLSSRQPTDLRDRLRNKYPERFSASTTGSASEKTMQQLQPGPSGVGGNTATNSNNNTSSANQSNLLEPTVHMSIENSLLNHVSGTKPTLLEQQQSSHHAQPQPPPPPLNRTSSRDDVPRWSLLQPLSDAAMAPSSSSSLSQTPAGAAGSFYWGEAAGGALASGAIGEMDISRLLLDDTQVTGEPPSDKRGQG